MVVAQSSGGDQPEPGVRVTFFPLGRDETRTEEVTSLPNVALYVPTGMTPTPFLPAGRFTAVWQGFLSVDIRSEYRFQAELNGALKFEINGKVILETSGTGGVSAVSQPIRLNKGTNAVVASFQSPTSGDAFLRLNWIPRGGQPAPILSTALSHPTDAALEKSVQLRLGRELFVEHRCGKCHWDASLNSGMPELSMDAPSFEGIGSRRNVAWLAQWTLDPKAQRSSARMPRLFHGVTAKEKAGAVAAFLASINDTPASPKAPAATDEQKEAGRSLFETFRCAACHDAPDASEEDSNRIPLKHLNRKFPAGSLANFLKKPEAHYAWTRMPNFKLNEEEAGQLSAYLRSGADKADNAPATADKAVIDEGKRLVETTGCLNCHTLKRDNQFSTKGLPTPSPKNWQAGCLAENPTHDSKAPFFGFTAKQREALRLFGATDRASLSRHVPMEFAARQIRNLRCAECHGKFDGFPPLDVLGGKLNPEWSKAFIAGESSDKPRPWLETRMPAFHAYAEGLAQGMALVHGYSPRVQPEPPIDREEAAVGQKLISAEGGFSCIACHAVGNVGATAVFESAGINLAYSGARLLRPYFTRWLLNPLAIDPTTKMPVYFDEESKSPLTDIYNGDGAKQMNAMWQYIRLGDKMPPPPGTAAAP